MKIIDGTNAVLGRLSSYVAKEALKGEDVAVLNCEKIIITGNKKFTEADFKAKRGRIGHSQKGPKISRLPHMIVKRAIRGMLPDHRVGRGRIAFKKIKCYKGIPKEFENQKMLAAGRGTQTKHIKVGDLKK